MNLKTNKTQSLPGHIEKTVKAIEKFHAERSEEASTFQKVIEAITAQAGQPRFVAFLVILIAAWVGLNIGIFAFGREPFDTPPFFWLQGVIALIALLTNIFILTAQRREDQLANYREQLTLELAILADQKSAKIIELIEELRRDHPNIEDRVDHEAGALASPADPKAVLDAIKTRADESDLEKKAAKASGVKSK